MLPLQKPSAAADLKCVWVISLLLSATIVLRGVSTYYRSQRYVMCDLLYE